MLRDAARQRDRIERGGHHQLLSGRESQSGAHGDFGEAIEILFEFRCLDKLPFGKWRWLRSWVHYHARRGALTMRGGRKAEA